MTGSIGAAASTSGNERASGPVARADAALYQPMLAGLGEQRRFDDRLREEPSRRIRLEPALARALEAEEFRVHYQPQVELASGVIVGLEAFIRWAHPDGEMMGPDDFVPLAERSGLIVPIGSWVLREACRQAAVWREMRPERPPFVSVNLSARELADPTVVDRVRGAIDEVDLDPALLHLELTESAVMTDPASATVILRNLRAIGVHLSIDHFGTGYSSLVCLKRSPVNELKIDHTFVQGVGSRADDTSIVAAVIGLAKSLGLTSLAEGIERVEQADALARLGCDIAQGYWWSAPAPADELTDLVLRGVERVVSIGESAGDDATEADSVLVALVHELRGPLTLVRGYAELLESDPAPPGAAPAIRRNADRLGSILQAIDDVNALDRGSLQLRIADEKFVALARETVDGVVAERNAATVTVEADPPNLEGLVISIDRGRIEQVLWNLIGNALRYGPPEGPVAIRITANDKDLTCTVIDHGSGIRPEDAERLFRKFARGHRKIPGSGLGLYLARGIARAHGGDVTYASAATGGAEFRLTLPMQ